MQIRKDTGKNSARPLQTESVENIIFNICSEYCRFNQKYEINKQYWKADSLSTLQSVMFFCLVSF